MDIRKLLLGVVVVLALTLPAGCKSGSSGGGGSAGSPPANDNVNAGGDQSTTNGNAAAGAETEDNANAADQDQPTGDEEPQVEDNANTETEAEEPVLTEEQEESVNDAVWAIEDLAGLFAALGAAQLPSVGDGPVVINPMTGCPTLEADGPTAFTVNYGDGCNPALYPDSTFSGSISGEVNAAQRTLTLTFNDFTIDGETVNGTVETGVSREDDLLILEAELDVTFTDGQDTATYTGEATVEIDLTTGELFIPDAEISVTDDTGNTYAIILDDVHIDPVDILPDSGTATLVLGTEGPGAVTMVITFTEDTPTDGTVLVSVNGSPTVEMSLAGLEIEP